MTIPSKMTFVRGIEIIMWICIKELIIFATVFKIASMKYLKTFAIIVLNLLFCIVAFFLLIRHSLLRPYAGSLFKESFSALLLLGSLYFNYFLLYPKIYLKYSYNIYWLAVVLSSIIVGLVDLAIAYSFIISSNAQLIEVVGYYNFFLKVLFFITGRNLALNFFPYLFRERQHLRHSLEKEREIVYERVRMLDVTDKDSNIQLVSIDEILYCKQQRNFTKVYTVQNKCYTRLGSMKHLEQLFGNKEFIRITTTILVPFQYIKSCKENVVVMRKMPWQDAHTAFVLDPKNSEEIAENVLEGLMRYKALTGGKVSSIKVPRPAVKRKPIVPPDEKIMEVFDFVEKHPECNSAEIIAETQFSLSTVERCLIELRKHGLVEHVGSRRHGGYIVIGTPQESDKAQSVQNDVSAEGEGADEDC